MNERHYQTAQNLCSGSCPIDHLNRAAVQEPLTSWPDIRGLNSLNYSRTAWLAGDAIEVALTTYKSGLPQLLQAKIDIVIPGVDPTLWYSSNIGDQALLRAIARPARRALARMKQTEYSLLPICTDNNHWVLAVVHKALKDRRPRAPTKEYSRLEQIAVLDPFRDQARTDMVFNRLRDWLEKAGGFTVGRRTKKMVWVASQGDATSCGPRAYWNGKQIMDRLLMLHEYGIDYDDCIWTPLSGWFNEHFVRGEMMGRCAWQGVRDMSYNARVSIECVNRVKDPKTAGAKWEKADLLMAPPGPNTETPQSRPRVFRGGSALPNGSHQLESAIFKPPTQVRKYLTPPLSYHDNVELDEFEEWFDPAQSVIRTPAPKPNQHKLAPDKPANSWGNFIVIPDDSDDDDDNDNDDDDDDRHTAPAKNKGLVFPSAEAEATRAALVITISDDESEASEETHDNASPGPENEARPDLENLPGPRRRIPSPRPAGTRDNPITISDALANRATWQLNRRGPLPFVLSSASADVSSILLPGPQRKTSGFGLFGSY